jgi:hypothetical protein
MPQDVFDALVIHRALADLAEDDQPFYDQIRQGVAMYPSEHAQVLVNDLNDAAMTAWKLTDLIVQVRPLNTEAGTTASLAATLDMLKNVMKENAEQDKPPRTKIVGGSLFNSVSIPLADRVGTCRKNLGLACQRILASPPNL